MEIIDYPIIDYLNLCLKTAFRRGFLWVMVLLAREKDLPKGYDDIIRYWDSYDDLTGDKIMFLLSKSNNPREHANNLLTHEQKAYKRAGNSSLLLVNRTPPQVSKDDYPLDARDYWVREEAMRNLSLHISPVLQQYNLSEKDIPAILLIPTMTDSSPIILHGIEDVYQSIRSLIIRLEPLLREYDEIQASIQMESDIRFKKYIQSAEYVHNALSEMDSDSSEAVMTAIENGDLSICARFIQPLRGHLNRLIDIQTQRKDLDFHAQIDVASFEEILEKRIRQKEKYGTLEDALSALRKQIYESATEYKTSNFVEPNEAEVITTSILHISDLHFTRNLSFSNMRDTVLREVREHVFDKKPGKKLLVITGDFHNYWTADFSEAIKFINALITEMGLKKEKDVFLIPGNHDVSNDQLMEALFKDTVPEWKKQNDESIEEIAKGNYDYIDLRMKSYVSYCQFARKIGAYPSVPDPIADTIPASVHFRRWRGKLNILHLNTTLVYKPGIKENQMLDIIQATDSDMWEQFYNDDIPTIVLGHNSFYDLKQEVQTSLQGRFSLYNVSAYLCGDTHKKEEEPNKMSIPINVKGFTETIPNIVCAKGVADFNDKYSDFGFYWHEWDETTDTVTVDFHRWRDVYLNSTAPDGLQRKYIMKRKSRKTSNLIYPSCRWKYRVLIMDDDLEQLNFLYQVLIETFENETPYHVSVHKATTPNEVLHMNADTDFDVFILDVSRNPELLSQVKQHQDFGSDMLKRMLEDRPNVKIKAKFIIYSRLDRDAIIKEFEGVNDRLNIDYISKKESIVNVANMVKNHFDYLYQRDISNL